MIPSRQIDELTNLASHRMYHLIYVSQAKKPMSVDELAALMTHSRASNAAVGITGLLIYRYLADNDRGNFMQMLEGERDAVEALWKKISADKRHHTKVILERGDTDTRTFPNWSMGLKHVSQADLTDLDDFTDLGSDEFWDRVAQKAPEGALDALTSFADDDLTG